MTQQQVGQTFLGVKQVGQKVPSSCSDCGELERSTRRGAGLPDLLPAPKARRGGGGGGGALGRFHGGFGGLELEPGCHAGGARERSWRRRLRLRALLAIFYTDASQEDPETGTGPIRVGVHCPALGISRHFMPMTNPARSNAASSLEFGGRFTLPPQTPRSTSLPIV